MVSVGKKAPLFTAPAVIEGNKIVQDFSLQDYIGKQAVVLFFYPKDFTFVCPTEIYGLQQRIDAFAQRNVAIVGCSTDTEETHWAWLHVAREQGGIQGVTFPLVADTSKTIAANFGVLGGNWYFDEDEQMQFKGSPVAHRGVFLIDKQGIVRHILINDLALGRSIDEILRTIDMMQHVDEHGEVCPVNWQAGETAFKPTSQDLLGYLAQQQVEDACHADGYACAPQAYGCQKRGSCGNCGCGQGRKCGTSDCRREQDGCEVPPNNPQTT